MTSYSTAEEMEQQSMDTAQDEMNATNIDVSKAYKGKNDWRTWPLPRPDSYEEDIKSIANTRTTQWSQRLSVNQDSLKDSSLCTSLYGTTFNHTTNETNDLQLLMDSLNKLTLTEKETMMGLNTQAIHHLSGPHEVTQMQNGPGMLNTRAAAMQQQQQAVTTAAVHMIESVWRQNLHQQVHPVYPDQGPRMHAPPNMANMPNMGQIGASSPYEYGVVKPQQKSMGINMTAMQAASRFTGTAGPIGTTNIIGGQESGMTQPPASSPVQPQSGTSSGGQPDPQQTTQGQMAAIGPAVPGIADSIPTAEKYRLLGIQLSLLLHAHKCQQRECPLPSCKTMKNVMSHIILKCDSHKTCTVPYCSMARQIMNHWKHCGRTDCPVCGRI